MENYNVELLPAADADLNDIFDYIILDSSKAAEEVSDWIFASPKHLATFPYASVKLIEPSLNHYEFRMVITQPYIAFYRIIGSTVFIYRVLHGARDFIRLLKQER